MMRLIGIHDPRIVDALATLGLATALAGFVFVFVTAVIVDLSFFRRVKITKNAE